jgi:NADH-quinone oxidoreductase subunit J
MLLGVDQADTLRDPLKAQRAAAIVLGLIILAEIIFLAGHNWATGAKAPATNAIRGGTPGLGNNVERVARSLFTDFLWPFEITAVLLVLAVIGAVVLARRSRNADEVVVEEAS